MYIEIDFESKEAIYLQLRNYIIREIALSRLKDGDTLPSVRQMAEYVGINMHTVNKAYTVLRREGFVDMDRRRGAVIAVDRDKMQVLSEMKRDFTLAIAKGCCKNVTKKEVLSLIEEIYREYDESVPQE